MKKFIKTLSLLLVAAFVSFPFAGCSDKTASKTATEISADNITDENTDETAENVSTEETEKEESTESETPADPEETSITGIYAYQRKATLKDVWFEKEEDAISFFNTRDINGVYNALVELGFYDFIKTDVVFEENEYASLLRFVGDDVYTTIKYNDSYKDLSSTKTNETYFKVETLEDGTLVVYLQFTYTDADGKLVETPAYVKYHLSLVEHSQNIFSGNAYEYKADSAVINYTNTDSIDADALKALATLFDIEINEESNALPEVVTILSNTTFELSKDLSNLTLTNKTDNTYKFAPIVDQTFTFGNITFNYVGRVHNITTGVDEISFTITLDENATFSFTCAH